MPNLLTRGMTLLASKLGDAAGESVTITRGATTSAAITAVPELQDYEVMDANGMLTNVRSEDWLFTTADMVLGASAWVPKSGDRIAVTLGGAACVFEVVPIGNKPCHEWADDTGVMTVVHSKKVA